MGIRLNEKDLAVLKDTARFRGLSAESIRQVHFSGSTYAWKRLNALYKNGYLGRKYYYALNKTGGQEHAQRIAAIYYPTPRALRTINYEIDARYVVPDDNKLDVHNMVSKLYAAMPGLLSKREAQGKYVLKNFMPVTCVFPSEPPVFISIIGKNKSHGEEARVIKFIGTKYFPGSYIVVSRRFPGEKLLFTDSYWIYWDLAEEVIPRMIADKNTYLDEFVQKFNNATLLGNYNELFLKVQIPDHGIFHLAELLTGSTRLMLFLRDPPEKTYILIESIEHLQGIKLERGSFWAYARKEGRLYRFYVDGGKMKHQLLSR